MDDDRMSIIDSAFLLDFAIAYDIMLLSWVVYTTYWLRLSAAIV